MSVVESVMDTASIQADSLAASGLTAESQTAKKAPNTLQDSGLSSISVSNWLTNVVDSKLAQPFSLLSSFSIDFHYEVGEFKTK